LHDDPDFNEKFSNEIVLVHYLRITSKGKGKRGSPSSNKVSQQSPCEASQVTPNWHTITDSMTCTESELPCVPEPSREIEDLPLQFGNTDCLEDFSFTSNYELLLDSQPFPSLREINQTPSHSIQPKEQILLELVDYSPRWDWETGGATILLVLPSAVRLTSYLVQFDQIHVRSLYLQWNLIKIN
jgi:hypothetical protein